MKNPPLKTAGDPSSRCLRAVASFPFRTLAVRRVTYVSKVGTGDRCV